MAGKKNGGAAMASPKEKAEQEQKQPYVSKHNISVRIDTLVNDPNRPLKAFASVNIDEYAVHGVSVCEKDGKRWVNMPQYTVRDEKGNKSYHDTFHPTTAEERTALGKAVLEKYEQTLEQAQNVQANTAENMEAPVQKM